MDAHTAISRLIKAYGCRLNIINKKKYADLKTYIVTVAFNKPDLISLQYDMLNKNMKNFNYFVVDNSTNKKASKKIKYFCKYNEIDYYKISHNPFINDASKSHGYALNSSIDYFLKNKTPKILVFLDHDIFPYKKYSFENKLKAQDFFGLKQTRSSKWYLWPGFMALKTEKIDLNEIDFLPDGGKLDTGGKLWPIYCIEKNQKVTFPKQKHIYLNTSNNPQEDAYEVIDESWIHLINGSNWANADDVKMTKKEDMIKNLINKV